MQQELQEKKERLYVLEAVVDHCPPVTVRNLFWNWTLAGELAIQPCPGGSSGFAKWRCSSDSGWFTGSPDLSDCQSSWLTRLTGRMREGEDVLVLAEELAATSRVKTLYGGDVSRVAELMSSLAHRTRQQLFAVAEAAEKERIAGSLSRSLVETGSNLLEDSQMLGWDDLAPAERAKAGSDLVLALQENSFLQANSINVERDIFTVENNIVASTRVMRARELADQRFRSADAKVDITIPAASLVENSENGAIRLLFFYYNNMNHILPSSTNGVKFLNSQVASASLAKGRATSLSQPLRAVFRHTEVSGSGSHVDEEPTCVWWDFAGRSWSEDGCWRLASNATHTTCACNHLANMAVLMEETAAFAASPQSKEAAGGSGGSTSATTVVIAAIVSVLICLVTVITTFIIFRRFSRSMCGGGSPSLPCLESKDGRTAGYYPYLSSSTTTTTLTPPTPGGGGDQDAAASQYCLSNECQVLRPLMITPIGPNSTIYRATFANGQQAHVIPISQQQQQLQQQPSQLQHQQPGPHGKVLRPITPSASHIYMEIDPVYNSETLSDILVSDLSDDDLRRSSEESGGSGGGGGRRIANDDILPKFKYHSLHYPCNTGPAPLGVSGGGVMQGHELGRPVHHNHRSISQLAAAAAAEADRCSDRRSGTSDMSGSSTGGGSNGCGVERPSIANGSDFNGVGGIDLPISATYTGTGQQLLRLDLKGQLPSSQHHHHHPPHHHQLSGHLAGVAVYQPPPSSSSWQQQPHQQPQRHHQHTQSNVFQ